MVLDPRLAERIQESSQHSTQTLVATKTKTRTTLLTIVAVLALGGAAAAALMSTVGSGPLLTVIINTGENLGVIGSAPGGINCGLGATDCSHSFPANTNVVLTPYPQGKVWFGWEGGPCESNVSDCSFVLTNQNIEAVGAFSQYFTLQVNKQGPGTGTITSDVPYLNPGINCGADCSEDFDAGITAILTAKSAAGSAFTGWSGGGCSGTGTCTVTMSGDTTVTATFTSVVTLSVYRVGSGAVASSPTGINCTVTSSTCTATAPAIASYPVGTNITLAATPAVGYAFTSWNGSPPGAPFVPSPCNGVGPACTFTMDTLKTVTAIFAPVVTLSVAKSGTGFGTITSAPAGISCGSTCSARYVSGQTVTLTASAASGSKFTGWSGACTGTSTCTITMNAATSVTANFASSIYIKPLPAAY